MAEISLGEHLERMAQPEATSDTALLVQGGGMRGAYSIGALAALEGLSQVGGMDFRDSFSAGVGSSAGAMNLAHYAAGHAQEGIAIYTDKLTSGRFIPRLQPFDFQTARRDIGHVIRNGGKLVDVDFLADHVLQEQGRITEFGGRIANSIHAIVTDAETGQPVPLRMLADDPELYEIFRATGALPSLYNEVVEVAGGRYVDGGTTSSIPLASAVDLDPAPKHILAVLTRENGYRNPPRGPIRGFLYKSGAIALARGKQSSAIKKLIVGQNEINCNNDLERLECETGIEPASGMRFTLIQPSNPSRMVSRLTTDRSSVADAAEMGKEDMKRALEEVRIPI